MQLLQNLFRFCPYLCESLLIFWYIYGFTCTSISLRLHHNYYPQNLCERLMKVFGCWFWIQNPAMMQLTNDGRNIHPMNVEEMILVSFYSFFFALMVQWIGWFDSGVWPEGVWMILLKYNGISCIRIIILKNIINEIFTRPTLFAILNEYYLSFWRISKN